MDPLTPALNQKHIVRAWCMYDWANSVYSLVIISAIFPVYYKSVAQVDGNFDVLFLGFRVNSSVLYSYALSFSFLVVAILLPLLSGVADYLGRKKTLMKLFVILGSFSCMGLYFFEDAGDVEWAIFCSIFASIGFSGSLVFYDAFLPEIVTPDRYDEVSARGYSMGYIGSVLLLISCLVLIMNATTLGFSGAGSASRFAFLLTGVWWIGFSMIPFTVLRERQTIRTTVNKWTSGYQEILNVWRSLKDLPHLKRYLWAFFFFNMGAQTVMYMATLFGTDVLHLESNSLILTVLVIQIVGVVGATLCARLSRKQGNQRALGITIGVWIVVCAVAYMVTNEFEFYAVAFVVGLIMGGIQALSRSTYAKLIPSDTLSHASYFSFYDVTYNLSIVFGTFSYGFILDLTGTMRNSALALAAFFIVGMALLITVRSAAIGPPQKASPSTAGA